MVSSVWSRKEGHRPTPSVCFPPPPPFQGNAKSATYEIVPQTGPWTATRFIRIKCLNAAAPGTSQVTVTWSGAGFGIVPSPISDNDLWNFGTWGHPNVPGTYQTQCVFTWPDGSIAVRPFAVTITP